MPKLETEEEIKKEYYREKVREIKIRERQRKDTFKDLAREIALRYGTEVVYVKCPLCWLNRPIKRWDSLSLFHFDPDNEIIQVRKGGGRIKLGEFEGKKRWAGVGFFKVASYRLEEIKDRYPEIWDSLVDSVRKLADYLERIEKKI